MKVNKFFLLFSAYTLFNFKSVAQTDTTDLLGMLNSEAPKAYTMATFKGTRLINFHTVEVLGKRCLDFRISHRFGNVNSGIYDAFGLDGGANIRLGLEYCHDARWMVGLGRTAAGKIVDGFAKYKLLRQTDDNKMPVTMTLFTSMFYTFEKKKINGYNYYNYTTDRMSFCHQILIARKVNTKLSLQLNLSMVHFNLVQNFTDRNDCFLAGITGRYKVTNRSAITVEYAHRINKYSLNKYYDSFGIGYDLETGGHVFQIHFTNSFGLTENQYLMYTNTSWKDWGIRLGFNISRVFALRSGLYE